MDVLLLTQEPPHRPGEAVSGNSFRCLQLTKAMEDEGHSLHSAWLSKSRQSANRQQEFRNADELQGVIARIKPGAIVVANWELLELLPYQLPCPVCVDFVAPRPLEQLFETPDQVQRDLRRLRNAFRRCDLVLVGNEEQRQLLLYTMIEAGFDLREVLPLATVPLGAQPANCQPAEPGNEGWTLVAGGLEWPWRSSDDWFPALADISRLGQFRVMMLGGTYGPHQDVPANESNGTVDSDLSDRGEDMRNEGFHYREPEPYEDFSRFLSGSAQIGLELSDWNIERAYSLSFSSLEFLRHGLPLICNRYLSLSPLLEQYDAGWMVDRPAELQPLLAQIAANPAQWREKSNNALHLVTQALSPERTARPLLDWLRSPRPSPRLASEPSANGSSPVLGVPPLGQRLRRQWCLIRQFLLARFIGLQPRSGEGSGDRREAGIIIVTRGDLFPANHGAAVRIMETSYALASQGVRVGLVTDERGRWYEVSPDGVTPRRYPWWLKLLSLPSPASRLLHHSRDIPHSRDNFLYLPLSDNSYFWRILAAARHVRPGVLQAEFPAYAKPCVEAAIVLRCGTVLVEHNVEYDRLRVQLPELTQAQYQNLRDIELQLCRRSDAVVCVSDNDRQKLEAAGVRAEQLHTIPHGVNLAAFDAAQPEDVRQRFEVDSRAPLLVFHGALSYLPNRKALRVVSEVLLPGLDGQGLAAHLLAVGRDPPNVSPHPRMHFSGSVAEIAPWLKAADIAVIPLTEGGGTRMKILDCFAAGLPVISTSKGVEGIPVSHGEEVLVIDDWPSFIEAIAELWRDRERAAALAQRGRDFAGKLDWSEIARRYGQLYASVQR